MGKVSEMEAVVVVEKSLSMILPAIRTLIETARHHVAVTANLALVSLYWNIGRIITQDIQKNAGRARYGTQLIDKLSDSLIRTYGQGYSRVNLQDMRRFFETFEICQPVAGEFASTPICQPPADISPSSERLLIDFQNHYHLGWTHYRILLGIADPRQRRFYFEQTTAGRWSKRELQRQIAGALFERVALSKNTGKLVAGEKKKDPPEVVRYEDIFKDPYLLDFLGLKGAYSEKDFEAAIIHNLEQFLTELGSDFCFIGRQYPMRIDDVDYYLDLLFFHRGLRCLVAIDLKLGTFTAADKGQMDLYLAWLKEHEQRDDENEPVGLILCSSKRKQHVELLLRHGPHRMQVSEYLTKLPDKKLLEERLRFYSRLLDQQ